MLGLVPPSRVALALFGALAVVAGCYRSHRRLELDAGPDAPRDAREPDAPDAPAPPACVHRRVAEAQLTDFVSHAARTPDLVRTPEGLSTIFGEGDGDFGHPIVSLVFTREDLSGPTAPRLVGEESHSWAEALALDDGSLAIAWLSDPGLVTRTAFRRISPRGDPFGDRVDVDFEGSTCVDLARAGELVAVAYRGVAGTEPVAFLAFVDPIAGGRRSERFLLGPDDVSPQLAPHRADEVVVALPDATGVTLRTFATTGELPTTLRVAVDRPVGRTAVASTADGLALAMQIGEAGMRGLRVVLVDADLGAAGAPLEIVPEGFGVIGTRIVATDLGYTLSWAETLGDFGEGRLMVLYLDHDGLPLEARRVVFAGQLGSFAGPGLASSGERSWLATTRPIEGRGHAQLFLAEYECVPLFGCDAMDARAPATTCDETMLLGYRWDGARCERLESCVPCEGLDCDGLGSTEAECVIDHVRCR